MKKVSMFLLAFALVIWVAVSTAQVSIGGYNVYYGTLHNHCNASDGSGTADAAYNYAKNTSHLDFFSLADHSSLLDATKWTSIKNAANAYNEDGVFAAFWGFEWTSSAAYGHVAVINTTDYCTTSSPTNTFNGLCDWLNSRECVAFFNHPGRENDIGSEFSHFTTAVSNKIVGMELWNKADAFSMYYYNDGYYTNDGSKSYYDEALVRNWNIGASGSEDNHSGTWGSSNYKMAVLANARTRADIYAAMQARRFYSTLDKNLGLSFKIDGNEMGTSDLLPGNYTMQILATDGDSEIFTTVKLIKNGAVVNTWNPNSANPNITMALTCASFDYFYVVVTEADNNEAISSPIRFSGTNVPPVVTITSPVNNASFNEPAAVDILANATDEDGSISKVEFYSGAAKIGEDLSSPYSFTWTTVMDGSYTLTAVATDNFGAQTTSAAVNIAVAKQGYLQASAIIGTSSDDAEESPAGAMYLTSTDIELVYDDYNGGGNQIVGLRFTGLGIPGNSFISNAFLQFTVDEATSATCNLVVKGEASDNSAVFTSANFNVSSRQQTTASVNWSPAAWPVIGEAGSDQRTPDLAGIVQEIVNRPGYNASSAITMIITGTGARTAKAYDLVPSQAPKLVVTYSAVPAANFIGTPLNIQQGGAVNFTDLSTNEPMAWNWSFPGGTPATSTAQNPTVNYDAAGTYSVTLTASNPAGSNTFTRVNYITVTVPGYCASQSTNYSGEYISMFTIGTFVNSSAGSYYSDFTNLSIPLQANKKYTVKITPAFNGGKKIEYFKVWIDYNNDFDFDDSGENIVTGSKNGELSKIFTTPSGVSGSKRMRVAMKRAAYPGTCETFTYGEVEDYTVTFGSKAEDADLTMPATANYEGLKIYPNPASQSLNVEKNDNEKYRLEIYSISGQCALSTTIEKKISVLDISILKPGLYFIKYSGPEGYITSKLIVN